MNGVNKKLMLSYYSFKVLVLYIHTAHTFVCFLFLLNPYVHRQLDNRHICILAVRFSGKNY